MAFIPVIRCAGTMFIYILIGYLLAKSGKASPEHARSFSGFLLYICNPCLLISAFQSMEFSKKNFEKSMVFFAVTLVIQIIFMLLLMFVFRKRYKDAKYRILTMCSTLGNVGFFGLPLVTSIFPTESVVASYSTLYVTSMNILVFTLGTFLLTFDKKHISVKSAILNPTTLPVILGIILYLCQFTFPQTAGDTIWLLGRFSTPLCMIILGLRLASMKVEEIFLQPFAWHAGLLKLIVFPIFAMALVAFLPFMDQTAKVCIFILSAAPAGAINLTLAELHRCEQHKTACAVVMTTLLNLVTIPLLSVFIS